MFDNRRPLAEIATELDVARGTVENWSIKYHQGGLIALMCTISTGRPSRLTLEQEQQLLAALALGCAYHGFPTEQWTMKRVVIIVKRLFGVTYYMDGLRPKMLALGLSPQKPGKQALERDEAAIEPFASEALPVLKKVADEGGTLVFLDETGSSFKTTVGRTWAPRGQTPIIKTHLKWHSLSIIGALISDGRVF